MEYVVLAGRVFYAAIFVMAGLGHFSHREIGYAAQQGVPMAGLLVPLSGVIALAGGLSVLLGYHTRIGAWLLVLFLVPVTLMLHNFWAVKDPMMAQMQMAMFMKNASMLGGALLIAYFGAGPLSVDARRRAHSAHARSVPGGEGVTASS
jgi:putative oxidoreductase